MSEEPGEDEPPSFEERLKAARGRQGLDAPPPLSARDSGDMGGMSPWGIGLRVGVEMVSALVVASRHRLRAGLAVRHQAHPDRGVRSAGRRGWDTQCLAPVRATTDTGT